MFVNYIFVPLVSCLLLFIYIMFSSFSMNSSYFFAGFIFDEISLFMVYMTCFVVYISFMFTFSFLSLKVSVVLFFMLFVCCGVFSTDNMFILYLLYECSLIPILYIILKWGSYPERSVSAIMLLVYTAIFTFPFLFLLFYLNWCYSSLSFSLYSNFYNYSVFISFVAFSAFAVKLPIYGLHFWLPMAHVEAPTFGSMILAGVLLKLGGVGLMRFSCVIDFNSLKFYLMGYFLVFLCYVTLVCCFQSDFKRLIAYSSVSHMMTIPIMMFSSNLVSFKGVVSVMFLHGLSSPLLFMLVGIIYSYTSTRQHIMLRGLITYSPLFSFFSVLAFFFTLSAPPFPSFISEVFFTMSSVSIWVWALPFLLVFLFLSIVYNLIWLSSLNFLSQSMSVNYSLVITFSNFLPIFMALFIIPLSFSFLFFNVM